MASSAVGTPHSLMEFLILAAAYWAVALLVIYAFVRTPWIAVAVSFGIVVVFPFASDTSDWVGWFDWAKRYSIVIPIAMLALWHYRPRSRAARVMAKIIPIAFAINILEAALFEMTSGAAWNGALLLVLVLTVPWRWSYDDRTRSVGFSDTPWQVASIVTLMAMYLFNQQFENIVFVAASSLVIAGLAIVVMRNNHYYVVARSYSLYVAALQDSFFPDVSDGQYPEPFHPATRTLLRDTWFGEGLMLLGTALVLLVVIQRVQSLRTRARRA